MDGLLLVRYGEIALKGNNRPFFEKKLVEGLKRNLNELEYEIERQHGRIFIKFDLFDKEEIIERVINTFGVVSVSPGVAVGLDLQGIVEAALEQFNEAAESEPVKTFKVESRRSNKGFQYKSPEISRMAGGYILKNTEGYKVDVHNPQLTVQIEVRDKAYVFTRVISGLGGMPYKSAGKAMLLLSGGIDSPVAGWMMARRGVEIEAVHYHSYPFTSERATEKVMDLGRKLAEYTGKVRVYSVNLLEIQKAINEHCPSEEMTILSRRFMMMIAERVAKKRKCQALITGESIGQVASQTIEGLNVTNDAVGMPVFRPLIAMDKVDIIKVAEKIDTYDISILPFEDCCTVFLPDRVVTKPRVANIKESQDLLDSEKLIEEAIEKMEVFHLSRD